jgi:archaellum component FlaC
MDKETKNYLDGQFKVVNEHLGSVDQKLDVVDERLDTVDKRLGTVDKRLDAVDQKFVETRRHFDVVAEDLTSKISLVVEGYDVLRRELQEFRGEVQVEFKELRSLVKFSYAD